MKLREFAGAVNRAKTVLAWVAYAPGFGCYVELSKVAAKSLVEQAKEDKLEEIEAEVEGVELYIGEELTTEPHNDRRPLRLAPTGRGRDEEE